MSYYFISSIRDTTEPGIEEFNLCSIMSILNSRWSAHRDIAYSPKISSVYPQIYKPFTLFNGIVHKEIIPFVRLHAFTFS